MKYSVYAVKSKIDGRIYVGLSANPKQRLMSHNRGETKSTKGYRPWILFYTEKVGTREEARAREKFLKSGSGKEFLKKKVKDSRI